jgi:spermidine synthase
VFCAGIICSGFLLGGAQVLLIRQTLAISGGDETAFALTLALWLLTVAAGSALGAWALTRNENLHQWFGSGLVALAIAVPLAVLLLPLAASWFGWIPGMIPGVVEILPALVIALLPVGIIGGALFPIASRLLMGESSQPVTRAYYLEAIGAFIAGTGLSLLFLPHVGVLTLASLSTLPGFMVAFSILRPGSRIWLLIGAILWLALLFCTRPLESWLATRLHPNMEILEVRQTPYGILEITRRAGQITVYENGLPLASSDDPSASEERSHLTLALHPNPRRILWIGGSLGGALPEVLRHPSIEKLDLVEINPALLEASRWFNSDEAALRDPRVAFHWEDGRRFLSRASPRSYDLIALNLPGPRTARLAKYYTVEGFLLTRRSLTPGGILVFTVGSSEDYLGGDLATLLASLQGTLAQVFPQVVVLPGSNAIFVAGDSSARIAADPQIIITRLRNEGIQPRYWDEYRLEDRLSVSRREKIRRTLATLRDVPLNRDAAPISLYFNQVIWSRQSKGGWANVLKAIQRIFLPVGLALLTLTVLGAVFVRILLQRREMIAAAWAIATVGITSISLEILALAAYQVRFGSGYREVGLLLGLYMAGLAIGALIAMRFHGHARRYLPIIQTHWILAAGSLIALMAWESLWSGAPVLYQGLFFLYLLVIGVLSGAHFPLALEFSGETLAKRGGRFYALDLAGAAISAFITGLVALPLGGMNACAAALVLLNAVSLSLLFNRVSPSTT